MRYILSGLIKKFRKKELKTEEKMKIAIIKKVPYLIHRIDKDKKQISLGLELYPDVEQNNYIDLNKVKILKKGTKKYNYHKKIVESLLV